MARFVILLVIVYVANMSERLKRHVPLLKALAKASTHSRKKFLKNNCSQDFIHCICECVQNILKGRARLSKAHKSKLSRHKNSMRKLILKKTSFKNKKKLVQTGGFIGALLPSLIKIVGGLFGASS